MQEIAIDTGLKFTLALLAIVLYGLLKVLKTVNLKEISVKKFLNDNKPYWGWTLATILTILLILAIEPGAGESLKKITGIDVNNERASFLTLGWALSTLVNKALVKPIGKKT